MKKIYIFGGTLLEFVRKYWFIVFSWFAFGILFFHTLWVHERYSFFSWRLWGHFFFLVMVFLLVPVVTIAGVTQALGIEFSENALFIYFYVANIYMTYLHICFRKKYGVSRYYAK